MHRMIAMHTSPRHRQIDGRTSWQRAIVNKSGPFVSDTNSRCSNNKGVLWILPHTVFGAHNLRKAKKLYMLCATW